MKKANTASLEIKAENSGRVLEQMTARERGDLCSIIRQREKVAKACAAQRAAQLRADFEKQLKTTYSYDQDAVWEQAMDEVEKIAQAAQKRVAERCQELGIHERFAPGLDVHWYRAGVQAVEKERTDLRRLSNLLIEASERQACLRIMQASVKAQTEIMSTGITSEDGQAFLARIPSVEELMPLIPVTEVQEQLQIEMLGRSRRSY
jgi:hypothetical protein